MTKGRNHFTRDMVVSLMVCLFAACASGVEEAGSLNDETNDPSGLLATTEATASSGVIGTWELERIDLLDETGQVLPTPDPPSFGSLDPVGQAVFNEEGFIGLTIMQRERPFGSSYTADEAIADLTGYVAFFGTYTLDEEASRIDVEYKGHRNPVLTGQSNSHQVELSGDTLTVHVRPGPSGHDADLVWTRLPEVLDLTDTHEQVIGFWNHVPDEGHGPNDPPVTPGFIIYTNSGRMMVHLMDPSRTVPKLSTPTGEEAQEIVGSYTSYFGPFSVDEEGEYFIHHRIGHTLNLTNLPKEERRTGLDTDAQRFFEFSDDKMVLRYLSTAGVQEPPEDKGSFESMITWQRLTSQR